MISDNNGKMYLEDNDIIELMLANRQVKILPSNRKSFENFQVQCKKYGIDVPFTLDSNSDGINWHVPDEYKNLDIRKYILEKHTLTQEELNRVDHELSEFGSRNLLDLLKFLVYLVSLLRSNNIVYGVGRGSSIASYVLYLVGVHRINSYKFNLDLKEFLK